MTRPTDDAEDWRTDTAERIPRAVEPASVVAPPYDPRTGVGPRWPLFADGGTVGPVAWSGSTRAHPAETGIGILEPVAGPRAASRRPLVLPWAVAAAVVVMTAGVGGALVAQTQVPAPTTVTLGDPEALVGATAPDDGRTSAPTRDAAREEALPRAPADVRARARSVVADATARAPATAEAAVDVAGDEVTFGAENLLDGDVETAWRVPGDAGGTVLTIDLGRPTWVTRVGLVNGYAKTAREGGRSLDWYAGNRRVDRVEWFFDDGSREVQSLGRATEVQRTEVAPVRTSTVRLRLARVSPPGTGPERRDFTAISEVAVDGTPVRRG